jgi:hypothetical protein
VKYTSVDQYGDVLCTLDLPNAETAALNVPEGGELVEGDAPSQTHRWNGGFWQARPAQPSLNHTWVGSAGEWQDQRTLAQARASKWAEIKRERSKVEYGQFTWDGHTFDCDAVSQSRLQGAVQIATLAATSGQSFSVDWTLADNSVLTISAADLVNVAGALAGTIIGAHTVARQLRAAIDAATTLSAIDSIHWPTA